MYEVQRYAHHVLTPDNLRLRTATGVCERAFRR